MSPWGRNGQGRLGSGGHTVGARLAELRSPCIPHIRACPMYCRLGSLSWGVIFTLYHWEKPGSSNREKDDPSFELLE